MYQEMQLEFLIKCQNNIIPMFLTINNMPLNEADSRVIQKCQHKRLRTVIRIKRNHVNRLSITCYQMYQEIAKHQDLHRGM